MRGAFRHRFLSTCELTGPALQQLVKVLGHGVPVGAILDMCAASFPQRGAQWRIGQDAYQSVGKRLRIVALGDKARLAIDDDLGDTAASSADDGLTARAGFQ